MKDKVLTDSEKLTALINWLDNHNHITYSYWTNNEVQNHLKEVIEKLEKCKCKK